MHKIVKITKTAKLQNIITEKFTPISAFKTCWIENPHLSTGDFNTVYVADRFQQVVAFVNNDYVALQTNSAGLPRRFVQQSIVRQNNKLQPTRANI